MESTPIKLGLCKNYGDAEMVKMDVESMAAEVKSVMEGAKVEFEKVITEAKMAMAELEMRAERVKEKMKRSRKVRVCCYADFEI